MIQFDYCNIFRWVETTNYRGKFRGSGPGQHPSGKFRMYQDQTLPPHEYCCGRYASYWNAFLCYIIFEHVWVPIEQDPSWPNLHRSMCWGTGWYQGWGTLYRGWCAGAGRVTVCWCPRYWQTHIHDKNITFPQPLWRAVTNPIEEI